mmetsp:Transcript_17947/g.44356  ORF Transcript_17947/g.44356 Transcript_17947/m.44356 type:complete len:738 (+) Transcript_17947:117-2330(+)
MTMSNPPPKRWVRVKKMLEDDGWELDRITGSHHVFTKPGVRCIPLAFHGGTISNDYAGRVLRQAGLGGSCEDTSNNDDEDRLGIIQESNTDTDNDMMAKEATSKKSPKDRRKQPVSTIPPTKAVQLEEAHRENQAMILRQQFERLALERSNHRLAKEAERTEILEGIQELIATGEFEAAIESTVFVDSIGSFGSSHEEWKFNLDVIFYRMVCLSEYALSSCPFNSPQQREHLELAFNLLKRFIELSPEQRDEAREFASSLQKRIVKEYTNGLSDLYSQYLRVDMAVRSKDNSGGLMAMLEVLEARKPDVPMEQLPASPEEGNRLMDELAKGFELVVQVVEKSKDISLLRVFDNDVLSLLGPIVQVLVRKMLIAFDKGDYECAARLSAMIESFAPESGRFLDALLLATLPIMQKPYALIGSPSDQLLAIAEHVKSLIPVYRVASESIHWKRLAGVEAGVVELQQEDLIRGCGFESMLTFIEQLHSSLSENEATLPILVSYGPTRRFIFDSFLDPVSMAEVCLHKEIFGNKSISQKVLPVIKDFSKQQKTRSVELDEIIIRKQAVLRKGKFDTVRVQTIRLGLSILKISNVYDKLLEIDSAIKTEIIQEFKSFVVHRYEVLPKLFALLGILLKFLFGPDNKTVMLLYQTIVMLNDLDIADSYYLQVSEGKTVGETGLAGGIKTPEASRAAGVWSLVIVFELFSRPILQRFAIGDEIRRLMLIDNIAQKYLVQRRRPTIS